IVSKVETAPMGPYSGRASKQEFSFHMVGWGASTGEAGSPLRSLLAPSNRNKGLGAVTWGGYSNPKVNYVIEQPWQQANAGNPSPARRCASRSLSPPAGASPGIRRAYSAPDERPSHASDGALCKRELG